VLVLVLVLGLALALSLHDAVEVHALLHAV
jgi:hypothetical protein